MTRISCVLAAALAPVLLAAPAGANAPSCPAAVTAALARAFPGATIAGCKPEREHGKDRFEAKLTRSGGAPVEVDLDPDGTILQVEEKIAVDALPVAVKQAFAARYPKVTATGAEKQTAGKDVRYEVAFRGDGGRKEATFSADGSFVGEE